MNKNDIVQLKIDNYGEGGEGVGRVEGMAVFVPFALKGETVRAKIILAKKSYAIGKLLEILDKSQERIQPKCPVFTKCGGCQLQHMNATAQSQFKRTKVSDCFSRIAFLNIAPDKTVVGKNTWRYRNKLQLPLADNNGLVGGFFAPNSHRIVEISDCAIQDEMSLKIFHAVKKYADENNIKGYNEFYHSGLLRHLVTRNTKDGVLITLVINGDKLPKSQALIDKLNQLNIKFGLYINENTDRTNVVTSEHFKHIGGLKEIATSENGIAFSIVPQSFLQVNEEIKEQIYKDAIEKAQITENDIVVNAYSGAGLLTAYFAKRAKCAYGIEIVKEATESANELALKNNLTAKMININGDCKEQIIKLIPKLKAQQYSYAQLSKDDQQYSNAQLSKDDQQYLNARLSKDDQQYSYAQLSKDEQQYSYAQLSKDDQQYSYAQLSKDDQQSLNAQLSKDDQQYSNAQLSKDDPTCVLSPSSQLPLCDSTPSKTSQNDTTLLGKYPGVNQEHLGKKQSSGEIIFVLDPPRKGVDIEILQELLKLAPDKIIYISCNPATLARDVGILVGTLTINENGLSKTTQESLDNTTTKENALSKTTQVSLDSTHINDNGLSKTTQESLDSTHTNEKLNNQSPLNTNVPTTRYEVTSLTPYDMFPQTKHVESLACLTRKK